MPTHLALGLLFIASTLTAQTARTLPQTVRAMYVEDQRDRGIPRADDGVSMLPKAEADKLQQPDWSVVAKHDEAHRKEVLTMVRDGKLTTAEDFYDAAMIMQHGMEPNDYLLAHVFAIRSLALGDVGAQQLAALTLDRYLQSIGHGQIFGTQYLSEQYSFYLQHHNDKDFEERYKKVTSQANTQQPYDETLLPDNLRRAFCVPDIAQQHAAVTKSNATGNLELPDGVHCPVR